jgi:hypothetical protein
MCSSRWLGQHAVACHRSPHPLTWHPVTGVIVDTRCRDWNSALDVRSKRFLPSGGLPEGFYVCAGCSEEFSRFHRDAAMTMNLA